MLRRLCAAVVLLVTGAMAAPALADAETVSSTLVRGRVFWGMQSYTTWARSAHAC